jgi:uncharacterized protein YdeI (YjbR/CyaY-like superfamily)
LTIRYFASPAKLRQWFDEHHADARELLIGFYKKGTGKPSVTYPEALDEALCVGWIDGVRKRVDDERYTVRFTPRIAGSYWSAVNTKRAKELSKEGRMTPAGVAAFKARDPEKTKRYSFEREAAALEPAYERLFNANTAAWEFFQKEPPSRRRMLTWWIASGVKEKTRMKRVKTLIKACAEGRRLM